MTTTRFRNVAKVLFALLMTLGLVAGLSSYVATPVAQAQTNYKQVPISTVSTYRDESYRYLEFYFTVNGSGTIDQIEIPLPSYAGTFVYDSTSLYLDGQSSSYYDMTTTREADGRIYINFSKPLTVTAGQTIDLYIYFDDTTYWDGYQYRYNTVLPYPNSPQSVGLYDINPGTTTTTTTAPKPTTSTTSTTPKPTTTAPSTPSGVSWLPNITENPEMPTQCGLNIGLVFDLSNSIINQGGVEASKNAALGIVKELAGTPTTIGLHNFNSYKNADADSTLPPTSLATQAGVDTLNTAINNISTGPSSDGGTNWEGGLLSAEAYNYDVIYFITDGVPTTDEVKTAKDMGTYTNTSDLYWAMKVANDIKASGTRIVPVMINVPAQDTIVLKDNVYNEYLLPADYTTGDMYWTASKNYNSVAEAIAANDFKVYQYTYGTYYSGGYWYTGYYWKDVTSSRSTWAEGTRNSVTMAEDISGTGDSIQLTSYQDLAFRLKSEIAQSCQGKLIVDKRIVDKTGAVVNVGVDWQIDAVSKQNNIVTTGGNVGNLSQQTNTDGRVEFKLDPNAGASNMTVSEVQKQGYKLYQRDGKNAVCTMNSNGVVSPVTVTNNGGLGFDLTVPLEGTLKLATVTCTIDNQNDAVVSPMIKKDPVVGSAVKVRPNGEATLEYTITMWNPDPMLKAVAIDPLEVFRLPQNVEANGDAVVTFATAQTGVVVTNPTTVIPQMRIANGSEVSLAERVDLPVGTSQTVTISVPIKVVNASAEDWTRLGTCDGDAAKVSVNGVPNSTSLSGDPDKSDDNACIPLIPPLAAGLDIQKVDASDRTQQIPDAEFTVFEPLPDGSGPDMTKPVIVLGGNNSQRAVLQAGNYWIVETKSPVGYQLLATPVAFKVIGHENGWSAELVRDEGGLVNVGPEAAAPGDIVTIQVADVQTGNLPKTGGSGLTVPLALAMTLIIAGFLYARRRA